MASGTDRLRYLAAPLAVMATAAGWWFGTSLHPAWWLAWLAPLPLLVYAVRARTRCAALATFVAFALGNANMWHYLHEVIRLPLAVDLSAILFPALLMVPAVLLWRALARRGHALAAMLSLPLATTGLSWLSAAVSPHGTFGNLAYSQMDALPVIQVAAVTGLWGVGFLVWLLPSLLAVAAVPDLRKRSTAIVVGIALLASSLGWGAWRLHDDGADSRIRVGLVSIGESKHAQADLDQAEGRRMLDAYLAEMESLASRGAQVIVAPESALLVRSHAIAPLQDLATRRGVRILVGVEDHSGSDPRRKHNAALVFEPAGHAPASYFKRHLIPGFEDRYTPGDADTVLQGTPRVGMAICKDLDFTATGRAHGLLGTRLLLVPAWDFGDDAWLHGRMAILRGVEGGFAMARAARNGDLTLSDDRGRVLAQASSAETGNPVTLVGDLPLRNTYTPYARWGDAFGVLSLLAALALATSLLARRQR